MPRLLIVDDDPFLLRALQRLFAAHGYYCATAMTAGRATAAVAEEASGPGFDLIILDVGLPDADGFSLCRSLRSHTTAPLLFLTARSLSSDKIGGLDAGADDYVTKPFDPPELLARARSLIRRADEYSQPAATTDLLTVGDLVVAVGSREVRRQGVSLHLTCREFELLHLLARHPNTALATDWILESVWGYGTDLGVKALTVCVQRLREKIEVDPKRPRLLVTIRGFGYKLCTGGSRPLDETRAAGGE